MAIEASEQIATRFVRAVEAAFENLRDFPLSGAVRERLDAGLRVIFHHPYAIYYLPKADEVVIIRVIHGVRDIAAIIERGEFT